MHDLVLSSKKINALDYVVAPKSFTSSEAIGERLIVYYISDIHIEFHIDISVDIDLQIKGIVDSLVVRFADTYESLLYIGGDVSNSIEISRSFYRQLRSLLPRMRIIAVLGNHELSEYQTIDEAVSEYALLFKALDIVFLHNSYIEDTVGFGEMTTQFLCVGGVGFAPFNDSYNADTLISSKDIENNREKEIAESRQFLKVYNDALELAINHRKLLLVFTHYPVDDWLPDKLVNSHCFYFNGHNHRNDYYGKNGATIVADNQIGYKRKKIKFKKIQIGTLYNPFFDYTDGYYQISVDDYVLFYRFNGQTISGECSLIRNQIEKGNSFYMIKKHGFYMFVIVGSKKSWLCVGAKIKRIDGVSHIEYFYSTFDMMLHRCFLSFGAFYKGLTCISDEVKKYGFSGKVHGLIVDLDFYNHIMCDPYNYRLKFYYSPIFGVMREYADVRTLLSSMLDSSHRDEYLSSGEFCAAKKRIGNAIDKIKVPLSLPLVSSTESHEMDYVGDFHFVDTGKESLYDYSRGMYQIQRLFDCNVLREWNTDYVRDVYIEDQYQPVFKSKSVYQFVKDDWRYYIELDNANKTKKNTMICFPILSSDKRNNPHRLFFPRIKDEYGYTVADYDVIYNFVESIPADLIVDDDIVDQLLTCLEIGRFIANSAKTACQFR